MRSALICAHYRKDPVTMRRFVRASTRLTHTDSRAEEGALAVALAAGYAAGRSDGEIESGEVRALLRASVSGNELRAALDHIERALERRDAASDFADGLGLARGVSGYVNHTVPAALYCWLCGPSDFRRVVEGAICLGGDSDTVGAIAGALAGATVGYAAIPEELVERLACWPYSIARMTALACDLDGARNAGAAGRRGRVVWPGLFLRHLLTLGAVVVHVLRRALPPY